MAPRTEAFPRSTLGPVPATVLLLAVPLAGLVLLLVEPGADAHWQHRPTHFWLILATALVNVVLGLAASEAARRRGDARATLVSLAFLSSAGFLALHAFATPGQLVDGKNTGFDLATPVGLLLGACFAALSAVELSSSAAAWVLQNGRWLRGAVLGVIVAWAAVSLAELPPFDRAVAPEDHRLELIGVAIVGCALYGYATVRYLGLYRRRGDVLPAATAAAWVLLAEALVAIALARSWHLSWWEWHLMMTAAFVLVLWAAYAGYRRSASVAAAFGGVYLDATLERVDTRTADGLRAILSALSSGRTVEPVLEELRDQGFTADETALLESSARELRRVDDLFRPYVSPGLADDLERRPELAELGGTEREVTVLFADLEGFTSFAERTTPTASIEMLNTYWAAGRARAAGRGRDDRAVRGRRRDGGVQRSRRATRPCRAGDEGRRRAPPRLEPAGGGASDVAALPRRYRDGPCGRGTRRHGRAAQLRRDRRHDQPRRPPSVARASRPGGGRGLHRPSCREHPARVAGHGRGERPQRASRDLRARLRDLIPAQRARVRRAGTGA